MQKFRTWLFLWLRVNELSFYTKEEALKETTILFPIKSEFKSPIKLGIKHRLIIFRIQ